MVSRSFTLKFWSLLQQPGDVFLVNLRCLVKSGSPLVGQQLGVGWQQWLVRGRLHRVIQFDSFFKGLALKPKASERCSDIETKQQTVRQNVCMWSSSDFFAGNPPRGITPTTGTPWTPTQTKSQLAHRLPLARRRLAGHILVDADEWSFINTMLWWTYFQDARFQFVLGFYDIISPELSHVYWNFECLGEFWGQVSHVDYQSYWRALSIVTLHVLWSCQTWLSIRSSRACDNPPVGWRCWLSTISGDPFFCSCFWRSQFKTKRSMNRFKPTQSTLPMENETKGHHDVMGNSDDHTIDFSPKDRQQFKTTRPGNVRPGFSMFHGLYSNVGFAKGYLFGIAFTTDSKNLTPSAKTLVGYCRLFSSFPIISPLINPVVEEEPT